MQGKSLAIPKSQSLVSGETNGSQVSQAELTAVAPSYAKPNLPEQNSCGLTEVPVGCLSKCKIG